MEFQYFHSKPKVPNLYLALILLAITISTSYAQWSTDPYLCGGWQRENNGFIDFRFNESTAPTGKKFCMWTISPSVPNEQYRYNMTIRNVNLDCSGGDRIGINYFDEESTQVNLGLSDPSNPTPNPLCIDSHEVWERRNVNGTVMVVILYVEEVVPGKGFYLEWKPGYESRIPGPGRVRTTTYSWGRPSVAPSPYYAAGFRQNEISTFGFVKANFTDGYVMDMHFFEITICEGQSDWMKCFPQDTFCIFQIESNGTLTPRARYGAENVTDTEVLTSRNGFFIIVKIEDTFQAGGKFSMYYDTVRG